MSRHLQQDIEALKEKIIEMGQRYTSLDAPAYADSQLSIKDMLKDEKIDLPDKHSDSDSLKSFLSSAMAALDPKEQKILTFFYGLDSNKEMNLRELGELFGLSKERIRQIKEIALEKLRDLKLRREYMLAA